MKPLETSPLTAGGPAMPEIRDWGGLPELPLSEVLRRLLPCLRSIYAFAGTCQPWRRLLRASAADLLRPGLPPLLLDPGSRNVVPFSRAVLARPIAYRGDLADLAEGASLLSASRGHHLLHRRGASEGESRVIIIDALTGAERREVALPSHLFAYHYAALTASHLLVFHSKRAFFSLPFPDPNPNPNPSASGPRWTRHRLPRSASFVTGILEFRGRVLGWTDRAQLLEFRLCGSGPQQSQTTVHMLPATGLPDATAFNNWLFGPRLAAAGDRLLLVLFMLEPRSGSIVQTRRVNRVAVYGLDMARMRWEELQTIGAYSLFVDCAGKTAAACLDVGSCGVEENRVYVPSPALRNPWRAPPPALGYRPHVLGHGWRSFPPGWEVPRDLGDDLFSHRAMGTAMGIWPSQVSVYPPLLF